MGLRPSGRVEGRDRVRLVAGEQQLALALGQPGAGVRTPAVRPDVVADRGQLGLGRDEGAGERLARAVQATLLVARSGDRDVEAVARLHEAVEVGHRITRSGYGHSHQLGLDMGDGRVHERAGVRVRRRVSQRPRVDERELLLVPDRGDALGGVGELVPAPVDRVEQLAGLRAPLLCLGDRVADRGNPAGCEGGLGGVRGGARGGQRGVGLGEIAVDGRERRCVVRGAQILHRRADALAAPGDGVEVAAQEAERLGRVGLAAPQLLERGRLAGDRRRGPFGPRADLARPLPALPVAVGEGVVEPLLEAERGGEVGPPGLESVGEGARAVLAELGDREREVVGAGAHRVVGSHEGDPGVRPAGRRSDGDAA